jgi:hypothetical protein
MERVSVINNVEITLDYASIRPLWGACVGMFGVWKFDEVWRKRQKPCGIHFSAIRIVILKVYGSCAFVL